MRKLVCLALIFFAGFIRAFGQISYDAGNLLKERLVFRSSLQAGKMMYTGHSSPDYPGFGMAFSGEVSAGFQSDGSQLWHSVYGYPEYSLSFIWSSMGNKNLYGYLHGFVPDMTFTLNQNGANRLKMRLGLGFAYFNKPHDYETNRMNVIIGSKITNLSHAAFSWTHAFNDFWSFQTGLHFIHCSNGHFKLPNLGLNLPLLFGSLVYRPHGHPNRYVPADSLPEPVHSGKFHIRAGYGMHELGRATTLTADRKYDVYTATITFSRMFWKGGRYHIGFTAKYYEDWYEKIRELDYYSRHIKLKSSAFSFVIGHEFLFNRLSLYTHGALNLYNPFFERFIKISYKEMNPHRYIKKYISGKLGLQYYMKSPYTGEGANAYIGLYIKSNFTQADFAEVAAGVLF